MDETDAANLRVELHVFSGTPDPKWTVPLTDGDSELLTLLREAGNSSLASRLGYSGFTVTMMQGPHVTETQTVGRCQAPQLETKLLERVALIVPDNYDKLISDDVRNYVMHELTTCSPH